MNCQNLLKIVGYWAIKRKNKLVLVHMINMALVFFAGCLIPGIT